MCIMFWPELADIRRWKGDEPPPNLHQRGIIEDRLVEPWNYPIVVEGDPNATEPVRKIVSKQGLDGTTPKERPTGEGPQLSGTNHDVFVAGHGEPMAGDPVSINLRSAVRRPDPGL